MVAKRKRVSRLEPKNPAHPKVSPSRSAAEGARRDFHKKVTTFSCTLADGLLKPTGNVASTQRIVFAIVDVKRGK
ncbi:hypothetical protein BFR77_08105 [Acinetobacter pittii]|nr:hypothetical protein BFR77_08105 [Acinetobacter pittii]